MKIEVFPSASGDCLLITSQDGKRLLADAGLPDAYDDFIASPLAKLRDAGERIDVAYVSHIDRDHIGGVLRMLDHEMKWRAYDHAQGRGGRRRKPSAPRPPEIGEIWHNAFLEDIQRTQQVDLGSALSASASTLAGLDAAMLGAEAAAAAAKIRDPAEREKAEARVGDLAAAARAEMLALSVGDAIEVNWRIGRDQLDIPLNPDFDGGLMTARPGKPIKLGSLNVTVLGPTGKELKELREDWIAWLKKNEAYLERLRRQHEKDARDIGSGVDPIELARRSRRAALDIEKDVTPPNLASLVLLVEENGKRVLLTGDAGDESLLRYLKSAGMLDSGTVEFDVLKVPHHGAHNSFSSEFAKAVRAQHYVFCGDGEHHNPEPDVVEGYLSEVKARPLSGGRTTTFWFNFSSDRAVEHRDLWDEIDGMFGNGLPASIHRNVLAKGPDRLSFDLP